MIEIDLKSSAEESESRIDYHLSIISRILNFQISSSILFLLSFFSGIFLIIIIVSALIFIPYLIFVLWIARKKSWLISFLILTVLPLIITLIFFKESIIYVLFFIIPIFFLYCFALRYSITEWQRQRSWKNQYELEIMRKESADKEQNYFT